MDQASCRGCQCTDDSPCLGGCSWIDERWCSSCEGKVVHYADHLREQARGHGLPLVTVFVHDGTTCTVASGLLGVMDGIEQARLLLHVAYGFLDHASGGIPAYEIRGS